jgi:hypothetical protein
MRGIHDTMKNYQIVIIVVWLKSYLNIIFEIYPNELSHRFADRGQSKRYLIHLIRPSPRSSQIAILILNLKKPFSENESCSL